MGVQGLWDLVSPVGRRVSVETLAGKRLAIDASIWMIQFIKAMRDEQGEMVRNAHLLGFFRRICKLLFLRTKPVFVFDGGTPALKRRTVYARRKQRDDAQAKVRKTAEKMLLNQIKKARLKELAKELEDQRIKKDGKGKHVLQSEADPAEKNDAREGWLNQEKIDEMLAASLAAEERDMHNTGASTSSDALYGQDRGPSTSACANFMDDADDEDDEEMILPMTNGNIDPTVLAALPPSMQLDLLVQMRERLMAENRQKYQKVKKAPQKFSELQIETYLKTVAFRREIDEVQKAASGKGVGGLQTARIASEGNKEFIFSSSFTGDKDALASAGMKKTAENQDGAEIEHSLTPTTTIASALTPSVVSVSSGNEATPSSINETRENFSSDVQTYRDERGHVRVSRVRAMGIRMTRDLQRNLDLMKEKEQDMISVDVPVNVLVNPAEKDVGNIKIILDNFSEFSGEKSSTNEKRDKNRPTENIETSLEISFEEDRLCMPVDDDDDFFARLVAGDPVPISSAVDTASKDHNLESDSDCEWEEGKILTEIPSLLIEQVESAPMVSQLEEKNDDETELQWEDGTSKIPEDASSCPAVSIETKSRGSIEEETNLQEAIKRSLEDMKGEMDASIKLDRGKNVIHLVSEAPFNQFNKADVPINGSIDSSVSGTGLLDEMVKNKSFVVCSPDMIPIPSADKYVQNIDMAIDRPCENRGLSDAGCLVERGMSISGETSMQSSAVVKIIEKPHNVLSDVHSESSCSTLHSHIIDAALADPLNITIEKTSETSEVVPPIWHSNEAPDVAINLEKSKEPASDAGINRIVSEEELMHGVDERKNNFGSRDTEDDNIQLTGARLEDEIQILDEEYANFEDEHRKLERNAASVNSEMFVECQELLQMFGLPYIIAPMEAEAQCAYMELEGLVEGVVTDDSDVFLFGARSVYKNIFDDRKYVEAYLMKDIEKELGLSREKLIRMAMLLGSDYTEGVSGIGIVNAIEVVNAFPEEDGLSKFREWVESPDPTILGTSGKKRGSSSKKRGSKSSDTSMNVTKDGMDVLSSDCDDNEKTKEICELENIPKITQIFMKKHRKVSKNWHIPSSFPSQAVVSAYASPQVDKSTAPCSWGKPDLFVLRRLCWEKFGWTSQKADDLLLPVLKEYDKRETQLRMEAFFTFNERFAKIRSKRVKQAVKGITGNQSLESSNEPKIGGKRNKRKKPTADTLSGEESLANIPKEPRKSKTSESSLEKETGSCGGAKTATRGRRKAQTGGRRKRKGTSDTEFSDADSSDDEQDLNFEKVEAPDRVRRSTRKRKAAKYAESDDEVHHATKQSLRDATEEETVKDQNFGEMAQCTAGESVPDEDVCGDYLFKGGGFCAEEDEPENEISTLKDDSAPVEIDRQYLETGGGFCAEEDEPENDTSTLKDDSCPVEIDRQYLETGGGFCFDDGDTNHDDSQNRTREGTKGTAGENEDNDGKMCSSKSPMMVRCARVQEQRQQAENDTASGSSSQLGKAVSELKVDTNSPMKGLSAMPNLRRKRKKYS